MVPQDSNYSDIRANNFAVFRFSQHFAVWKDRKLISIWIDYFSRLVCEGNFFQTVRMMLFSLPCLFKY